MAMQGMDFSRSNQAISRFNQFLQYDLLDQFRSDRDVAVLQVSDRLQRERAKEAGGIEMEIAQFKSNLSDKEAYLKAMLDIKKLPQYDYLTAMARLATDPNLPPQYHEQAKGAAKQYAALIGPLAQAAYNASRGLTTWEDYQSLLYGGGYKGMEEGMKETGTNIRARISADTAAAGDRTARLRIASEEAGRSATATDKVTERYIKWIDDSISYLVGEGVQGEAMAGDTPIYLETKTRDPLSSKDRGTALTYLNDLKARVIREGADTLTDGNISFITKVWNTPLVQGFVSERMKGAEGETPAPRGKGKAPAPPARGGINPETGATPQEEADVFRTMRKTLLNQKIQEGINMTFGEGYRPSPEELSQIRAAAKEYVDTRLGPTLWENWSTIIE